MENTQLSNLRTTKELENELKSLLIKRKHININLRKLIKKDNYTS